MEAHFNSRRDLARTRTVFLSLPEQISRSFSKRRPWLDLICGRANTSASRLAAVHRSGQFLRN